MVAGSSLVAGKLCLAGMLAAFLIHPAYGQSGDEPSASSNLTAAIADGGVILNWSSPVQDASSVTGYEILRRRPREGEGALLVLVADTGSTATTHVDATADEPGVHYVYGVNALRGGVKSYWSNLARIDLPEEADDTEPTPDPAPRGVAVQASDAQSGDPCPGGDYDPTPTEIAVSSVPIEVSSTTSDYFVLYANVGGNDIPVQVKRGESGTTTLEENIKALPASDYRVEKYAVAAPADVDLDCLDDLADPSPLNHSHRLELDPEDGAMMIANQAHFEELANAGVVKFVLVELGSSTPEIYFQNTEKYLLHIPFAALLGIDDGNTVWGPAEIKYDSNILLNGEEGVYHYTLNHEYTSSQIERIHTLLAANLPVVDHNLAYSPWWTYGLPSDWVHDENPRVPVVDDGIIFRDVSFSALNAGEGYGRLQVLEPDDRPNPRDIVLYETLPSELSRVAGIISTQPQTPLSHVNLRAKQDRIPNAFIRDALDDAEISSLVGLYVYYRVTENAFELRAAIKAEVDDHYEASRPTATQTPVRDLSVTEIAALSDIGFDDWDAFGVKAANVAVLGTLGFPNGTVPDGFAVPFYFYDEFMKANDLYSKVSTMLADSTFQTDYDTQEAELKDLRDAIKDATTPDWIITALEEMHAEFPGKSLRYRSSTNNEDLPGFSGAGLYDSKTQDPEETEEDGIDKSIKGVWASLWNFRAFVERDFYRIDHKKTAMGVLVHPNYTDEWVNGVAVSFDPLYGEAGHHYVNSQVGEDLVTNPEAYSLPEELLLKPDGSYTILHYSNLISSVRLLMSDAQLTQLRDHLTTIHDHFEGLYNPGPGEPFAMEIEFKITSKNVLAIKQARPWVFSSTATPPSDRAGTVTLRSTQPRVGAALTASLTDPDGSMSNLAWQWAGSPDGSSNWATLSGAASATYTPVEGDVGNYLRAVASYTDGHGPGKTAAAVSANQVQDAPPVFPVDGNYVRSIRENTRAGTNLGAPVRATDASNDRLTYSIPASDYFGIDASSGQLRTRAELDHEGQEQHFVTVTATDPGGLTDSISVTITVEDVDETPVVSGPTSSEVAENGNTSVGTYTATDPDNKGIEWVLAGTDSGAFALSGGALTFRESPDYEEGNQYRVTIEAREQSDGTSVGRLSVTVNVTNVDEPGMVEVPVSEPRVGQRLTATVSDQDGGVGSVEWKWERRPTGGDWTPMPGATSRTYTPARDDNGHDLRVTAIYRDGHGPGKTETYQFARPVELRPYFEADTAATSIQENTPEDRNVGSRFTARHPDNVNLTYSLAGADGIYFDIDETTGQLKASSTPLDYETLSEHQAEVAITATDSNGQIAAITVAITVTDECTSAGEPPCVPGRPGVSSASDIGLRVSWSAPRTPSGTSITGYALQYRESGSGGNWIPETVSGTDRSHTIENLTKDTTYEVQVRASNDANSQYGQWSQSGTGTPGYVPPPPPPPPPPPVIGGGGPVETDNECADELGALADAAIRNGTWASDCESSVSGRGNARYYSFSLSVETAVTIDLTSSVDTYLYLRQGDATSGAALHENDNHQGSTSASRIQETLAAGTYTVEATTNSAGATGPFTLTITVEYLPTARVSRADGSEDTQAWPGTPVSLTVTFSRPVSGFTIDDINVENAAVSNFAGSGAVYTFDVTPNDIGEVAVDISAGAAKDAYGNGNEAAPRFYLGIPYDDDGDGTVSRVEAIAAIRDYFDGKITRAQAIAVIRLYFA